MKMFMCLQYNDSSSKTVYPPPCDIFSALNQLPVDQVKVVIVGQDPYHQPNQGHGELRSQKSDWEYIRKSKLHSLSIKKCLFCGRMYVNVHVLFFLSN